MPTWEFPGGPVVRLRAFTVKGVGSIPGHRTKILQATWSKKKKKKVIVQKFSHRNESSEPHVRLPSLGVLHQED